MGCASCGTSKVAGCNNNGHCQSGGCNKLNTFDWLSNMDVPAGHRFDVAEIRFKNGRKEFFRNSKKLDIVPGDPVVVNVPNGHHIGYVSMTGELVRLQMNKKGVKDNDEIREIYREASGRDIQKWEEAKNREEAVMYRTKEIIQDQKLEMKLTDVEFQADATKATFFYSAEGRVDFRELIKLLAFEFKIRIEMRQISLRQEASRIGGLGVCGRELCCSTWLTAFKSVSTSAARYQNLSLNPTKLSGQCGRLKCCLNYELDTYIEALQDIPQVERPLKTKKGEAKLEKTDIFRKILWFSFDKDDNWYPVSAARVGEIIEMNKKGKSPATLLDNSPEELKPDKSAINNDLEEMDRKYKSKNRKNRKKKKRRKNYKKPQDAQNQNQS